MEFLLSPIGAYLFIFFARVIDISLDVVRLLMLMRGRKVAASLIGFVEVTVFIIALGEVFRGGMDDPFKIIAYAAGFATGNYVGSLIEEWLAVGHLSMQVYPATENVNKLTDKFREQGFGVTSVCGCGRSGERTILFVLLDRKYLPIALKILDEVQPGIFYNVADSRAVRGGIFPAPKSRLIKTK
ncbi:DUF2179 domain-containing protein [Desulforamulus aquiferis]|uniref:UPF0316 protein P6N53_13585 n=1 Tax=Desulforamulus aquiferis TaxID=1397668 RepID=A0AAW7ZEV6_9FIRM|nr:DUF5698 domain-containing protein [Desulforamulus aquiferis]MDO7788258.1 DUF5698 domain-containing protein [Desulforamulus aquiferis]